jgi:HK97 family phage major capsid protein
VRSAAQILQSADGRNLPWPTTDDTANVGEMLAENIADATQDIVFGQTILKSSKFSSKIVLVSRELTEDSGIDLQAELERLLAERIGRAQNPKFTVGNGSTEPQRCVVGASQGKVGIAGQTTSVIWDDLVDLYHSIDPLYRMSGSAVWMMNDSTLAAVRKLKDSAGQPIVTTPGGADVTGEGFILGRRIVVNNDMAPMSASAKSVLFGDFSQFVIRDSLGFALLRLQERYAEIGQVGFLAFQRSDSRYVNTAAVKYYSNAAS